MITKKFILAGNAIFTVSNTKTGNRFTYKITTPKGKEAPHFVKALTGPNNYEDYQYLGVIQDQQKYYHGKKSNISSGAPSAKAFEWIWINLDKLPEYIEVHHEGKCGMCGKKLTTPESIETGIGPICMQKLGG